MPSVLNERQSTFVRREKEALGDLRLQLAQLGAPAEELALLQDALLRLDELFLIVVAGEFNAGKSRLINALLGRPALPEGVLPTTSRITVVRYGDEPREAPAGEDLATVSLPVDFLRELTIVDTPGTNAVVRRHEQLTRDFVPRSDLVLFVTSADRPFSESEHAFLELIRDWGKKIVLVVNKLDILEDERARREVTAYVTRNAATLLGLTPEVFPVSARDALRASSAAGGRDEQLWAASGFAALEDYVLSTLHAGERLRLKLESPVGVAERLVARLAERTQQQASELAGDVDAAGTIERQIDAYARELQDELAPRLDQVELILRKLEARGIDFFDSTIRLTKIFDLARGDRVRALFERDVLDDVPQQVEHQVQATIDWLVEKDLREWQQVSAFLQRRQAQHAGDLVGQVPDALEARRRRLLDDLGETAQRVLETYDRQEEARRLAGEVESAVAYTAIAEVGAVGLGAAIISLVTTAALDVTGVVAAGTVAILGLFIIPYKRRQAKERFEEKIGSTRARLNSVLTTQFGGEAERSLARLRDGVAPYTRFVRAERERLDQAQQATGGLQRTLASVRAEIRTL